MNTIRISAEQSYHSHGMADGDALLVLSGGAQVSVARRRGDDIPLTYSLKDVSSGTLLPCFSRSETDGTLWEFVIRPREGDATLQPHPRAATRYLKSRFLETCGISQKPGESFEECLMNWFSRQELEGVRAVIDTGAFQEQAVSDNRDRIGTALQKDPISGQASASRVYDSVRFLCARAGMAIRPYEEVRKLYDEDATVSDIAEMSGFLCRPVTLDPDWFDNDCGYLVAIRDSRPVACYPVKAGRYRLYDPETRKTETVCAKDTARFDRDAYSIGRALPDTPLTKKDMLRFARGSVRPRDIVTLLLLGVAGALIGLLLPTLNQQIYDDYIPLAAVSPMLQLCVVIATFMIGNLFFSLVKGMLEFRVASRVGYDLQDAMYYRVFRLPQSFFRTMDSADLAQRLGAFKALASQYVNAVVVTGFSTIFSLLFLFRMISDSGKLTLVSSLMLLAYAALVFFLAKSTIGYGGRIAWLDGEAVAKLYQYIGGVDKLRMAGAEDAALKQYLIPFVDKQRQEVRRNRVSAISPALGGVISSVFSMVLYYMIVHSKLDLSMGRFIAFNTAFGSFSSAILSLTDVCCGLYALKPILERVKPLLQCRTEDCDASADQSLADELEGGVSVRELRFRYSENAKVLKGVSMEIAPGEYVGIVGASGCGKSTLLKLLLGFETPDSGSILYDGKDLRYINKRALRKRLGVVLQNGELISGSIQENITFTRPRATYADIQRVIDQVGLRDDIAKMPMGVQTMVSEGGGVLSGGQVQRILIARAIIGAPRLLLFDEATSALDNITQRTVCESLERMRITRIVIAHRLSTIERCDRIYYMKDGRIAEQGSYAELMALQGEFFSMAQRQLAYQEDDV